MYGNLLLLHGDEAHLARQLSIGRGAGEFSEQWLRDRLFENPSALPFAAIDASYANSVPICREMRTDVGPIDALYANEHGLLTILECKLWRNPEARREVVGQVLDYASAMARLTYEDLSRLVNAALKSEGNYLFDLVRQRHPELIEHEWVDHVSRNLSEGRFLLLVAGDGIREGVVAITEQLQRGVGLRFNFGLVEVAVFRDDALSLSILQPRLLARTVTVERSVVRVESHSSAADDWPVSASVLDADEADVSRRDPPDASTLSRRKFWDDFVATVRLEGAIDAAPKKLQQNSAKARLPLGQWITVYRGEISKRIGIWFQARGDQAHEITERLWQSREDLESEIEGFGVWRETDEGDAMLSAEREESDFRSAAALASQTEWLAAHLKAFVRVLGPRLRSMERDLSGS